MLPEQIGQGFEEQCLLIGSATGGKPVQLGGCLARELYRSTHTAVALGSPSA